MTARQFIIARQKGEQHFHRGRVAHTNIVC